MKEKMLRDVSRPPFEFKSLNLLTCTYPKLCKTKKGITKPKKGKTRHYLYMFNYPFPESAVCCAGPSACDKTE